MPLSPQAPVSVLTRVCPVGFCLLCSCSVVSTVLFSKKSSRASKETVAPTLGAPQAPAAPDVRAAQFLWTAEEDGFLLTLVKQYNNNWTLISDLFNSTRMTVPTDRREAWDCFDRWKRIQEAAAEGRPPPGPPQLPSVQPQQTSQPGQPGQTGQPGPGQTSAGSEGSPPAPVNSLAAKRERLNKKLTSKYDGSRKKLRRVNLIDVMRKCAKRRDAAQKPAGEYTFEKVEKLE